MADPLFPCRYETWVNRKTGRAAVVLDYDDLLVVVEYANVGGRWAWTVPLGRFLARFRFVASP